MEVLIKPTAIQHKGKAPIRLPTLGVKINSRRMVRMAEMPNGEIIIRWTKNRNQHTVIKLTRKGAEATASCLIDVLNGVLKEFSKHHGNND